MSTITVSTVSGLADALQTAPAGQVILLASGTYSGVAISNLHIAGTITIQSADSAHPAVISGLTVTNSSGLAFNNLTLTTVGATDPYYVDRITGSSNVSFNDCLFTGSAEANPS